MNIDRAFILGLAWRLVAIVLALAALVWLAIAPGYAAATVVAWLACVGLVASLWRYVQRTNVEVARFVEALTYADFSQTFGHKREGTGFEQLGASMNAAVAKLRAERARAQDENRLLAAFVDEVPTPLVRLDSDGRASLLNKAGRRMFAAAPIVRGEDLSAYGARLAIDVAATQPGERRMTQVELDGAGVAATLSMAELRRPGFDPVRVAAIQPIQRELDDVEMAAQADLVRVLTHEIMNSVTPIVSLAQTAAALIAEAGADPALADARAAVETVARRADGVMHFVQTYRQISRAPPLRIATVNVAALVAEIARLFRADWPEARVALACEVEDGLEIEADPDLMAQVLINLARNAAEAAAAHAQRPRVTINARRNRSGRATIEVADNGPGVAPARADEIFLPFFTTKASGTGVGLSLVRQIVLAHGGGVAVHPAPEGGALFRIVL